MTNRNGADHFWPTIKHKRDQVMQPQCASRSNAPSVPAILAMVLIVPLLAMLTAIIGPYSALPYVAIVGSVAVFTLPLKTVIIACLIAASLLAGVLEYFGSIAQGFWLPYLMGILLAFRGLSERLRLSAFPISVPGPRLGQSTTGMHPIQVLAFIYASVALFGLAANLPPLPQVIVGAKNYFFLWGVLLVLLWSPWQAASSKGFWTTVVVIACTQWPFTLYQRFVVAAHRHDAAAWDSVVGTLGGDPSGGGNSAAMAFVCCAAIAVLLLRIRNKQLKILPGFLLMILCLLPIALAEVKAAFIWLVVVFAIIFGRQVVCEPQRAIAPLLISAVLLVCLGLTYLIAYQDRQGAHTSLQDVYDKQIKYSIDPNEFSIQYRRLGRITSLNYWWQQHDLSTNSLQMLVGHGLGASRSSSTLGIGEVAKRIPYAVDGTAASALLWDVGLLGAVAFMGMLGAAALSVLRLGRQAPLEPHWREAAALSGVVLTMALLSILYNKDAIDNPTVQILLFFAIAQFFVIRKRTGDGDRDAGVPAALQHLPLKINGVVR